MQLDSVVGKEGVCFLQNLLGLVQVDEPEPGNARDAAPLVTSVGATVEPHAALSVGECNKLRQEELVEARRADSSDFVF